VRKALYCCNTEHGGAQRVIEKRVDTSPQSLSLRKRGFRCLVKLVDVMAVLSAGKFFSDMLINGTRIDKEYFLTY